MKRERKPKNLEEFLERELEFGVALAMLHDGELEDN